MMIGEFNTATHYMENHPYNNPAPIGKDERANGFTVYLDDDTVLLVNELWMALEFQAALHWKARVV